MERKIIKRTLEIKSEVERMKTVQYPRPDKVGAGIAGYLALQNLRAYWPFSSYDENGNAYDISGQGRTLTNNGGAASGLYNNKIAYIDFDGAASAWLERADEAALQISGSIMLSAWVNTTDNSQVEQMIICKDDNGMGGQQSYGLKYGSGQNFEFYVYNGTQKTVASSVSVVSGNWYHVVGILYAGVGMDIFVNGVWDTNANGVGSIDVTTAPLIVGLLGDFSNAPWYGQITWPAIAASAPPRKQIEQRYDSIKTSFKVYA